MGGKRLDVSVVLPTYNESGSLPVLVPRIVRALSEAGLASEVIVVDDNSPDRTAEVAEALAVEHPVRVLKRVAERGLATAVIAGFRMSEADVCVVMDADGSHPVEALSGMVKLILADKAEIVVGSRHVAGGGSKDWPLFSQLKSRFAASLAFGLTSMTDPTTGFMAIRRTLLGALELDPVGWKIVLETVVKAHPARLAEVPIVFKDREHGESKQNLYVLEQYLEHLYKLYKFRFPTLIELLKFCLVGLSGVFVDLSIVSALKTWFGMDTRLCQVFGFAAAVSFNFAINRRFSFERARETPLLFSYVAYVGANMVGLTVRMLAIALLMRVTELDRGHGYLVLSAIGIALATLVNFVGVKYFAFAPERLLRTSDPDLEPNVDEAAAERPGPPETHTGPSLRAGLFLLGASAALLFAQALTAPGDLTRDEIVNLAMASNIRLGLEGFVHPSTTPGLVGDWQREALPLLGNTPIYPLALALFDGTLGRPGLALLQTLTWIMMLAGLWLAWKPLDRGAAQSSVMLAGSAPFALSAFSLLEFEPLVASFGALGFAALARYTRANGLAFAALSGLCVGLGFATKMWLVVPALFACVAYLVSRTYRSHGEERASARRAALAFALSFVVAAGSHLAFIAIAAPDDLAAWLDWVYFGLFNGRGATGPKLSGSHESGTASAFAYAWWLMRDHGALLVILALGLPAATRRVSRERRAFFAAALGALLGLVPLSVPAAKEPLYMAPVLPFLYMLAGLALIAPDRTPARYTRVNRGAARASLAVAALLSVLVIGAALSAGQGPVLLAALRVLALAVWTGPSVCVLTGRPASSAILPCALVSLALGAAGLFFGPSGLSP